MKIHSAETVARRSISFNWKVKVTNNTDLNNFIVRLASLGAVWQQGVIYPKSKPPVGRVVLILLVGSKNGWIEVHDPNHDNKRYGSDRLIAQGIRNDEKVKAQESLFRAGVKQYWIIYKESDDEVTREEYEALINLIEKMEQHVSIIWQPRTPVWAYEAIGATQIRSDNNKGIKIKVINAV